MVSGIGSCSGCACTRDVAVGNHVSEHEDVVGCCGTVLALGVVLGLVYQQSAKTQVERQYVDKEHMPVILSAEARS